MTWKPIDSNTPYDKYIHVVDEEGLEHIAIRFDEETWSNGYANVRAVAWLDTPAPPERMGA